MIKKMDLYIIRKFLVSLLMTSLAFLTIFFVVDIVENLRRVLDSAASLGTAAQYSLLNLPWLFNISLPIAVLLASVLTFTSLVKYNELVPMKSAGVSLYRLLIPMIFLGLSITAFSFYFGETVVIDSNRKRFEIARKYSLRGAKRQALRKFNLNFQEGPARNISIGVYKFSDLKGERINIQYFRNESLIKRIDAAEMKWDEERELWLFSDVIVRNFKRGKEIVVKAAKLDTIILRLTPDALKKENRKPEEMSYWELGEFVKNLEANGIEARNWKVNHIFKISLAFSNFIVVLIGVPIAANKRRGGAAFGIGVALLISFFYYGFMKLGQTLAKQGVLEPLEGVWLGNAIFFALSIIMILRTSK
ncbi:MAG: LptF/LptG family permease [Candidatus Marinimicrobia bacterium]|nr:LptF/LptG family permease [Candidatus Neomarinimicrobiota bacterium]